MGKISNQWFLVTGASQGFGEAVVKALLDAGASVLVNARKEEGLNKIYHLAPDRVQVVAGDISEVQVQKKVVESVALLPFYGAFINAGGPVAGKFDQISMEQWDKAYYQVLRWKVQLLQQIIPLLKKRRYGRLVLLESVSIKQPLENLVLSNAFRAAVAGMAKTLANEVASYGVTVNLLAPGYHQTGAMERLFRQRSESMNISIAEAKKSYEDEIPVGEMGHPEDLASLVLWLLSPAARYVTGQTISIDGGLVRGIMG